MDKYTPEQWRAAQAEVDAIVREVDERERRKVAKLQLMRERYAAEYAVDFDAARASKAAGYSYTKRPSQDPRIAAAVNARIEELNRVCELNAEYVRGMVLDGLELCPTDYFTLAEDGDWTIDPESFRQLPTKVKRLVDGVELKFVRGRPVYRVEFVSKATLLGMAVRMTHAEKHLVATTTIPWDELIIAKHDTVEQRLADAVARIPGSNGATGSALAAH